MLRDRLKTFVAACPRTALLHLRWLGEFPIFGLELGLLFAILYGLVGADYGLRDLFLQDDRRVQFVSGVSVAVFVHVLHLMTLTLETKGRSRLLERPEVAGPGGAGWYGPSTDHVESKRLQTLWFRRLLPLGVLLCFPWVFDMIAAGRAGRSVMRVVGHDWAFPAGIAVVFAASGFAMIRAGRRSIDLPCRYSTVFQIAAILGSLVLLADVRLDAESAALPASVTICAALGGVATVVFATFGWRIRRAVIALVLLGLIAATNSDPYKLRLPDLDVYQRPDGLVKTDLLRADRDALSDDGTEPLDLAVRDLESVVKALETVPEALDVEALRRLARAKWTAGVMAGHLIFPEEVRQAAALSVYVERSEALTDLAEMRLKLPTAPPLDDPESHGEIENLKEIAEILRRALASDPGNSEARALLIGLEFRLGSDVSVKELKRLFADDRDAAIEFLESLSAAPAFQAPRQAEALALADKNAADPDMLLVRGYLAYRNFHYPVARQCLEESVALRPSFAACMTLSFCYAMDRLPEKQLAALNAAYRLKRSPLVHEQRAGLLYKMGRDDEAIEEMSTWADQTKFFAKTPPRGPNLSLVLIPRAHMRQKRWREAADWLAKMIQFQEDGFPTADLHLLRAVALSHLGEMFEADLEFQAAEDMRRRPILFARRLSAERFRRSPISELTDATKMLTDEDALKRWAQSRRAANGGFKPKLVVVATSGGGIAAAHWTTLCLTELEKRVPEFPRFVRVITGASGGMVGAANYVASLKSPDEDDVPDRIDQLRSTFGNDFLTPVVRRLVIRDIPSILCPKLLTNDRGKTLDRAFVQFSDGRLGMKLHELRAGEARGWRPSLIISPTIVEAGRPLVFSNLTFAPPLDFRTFQPLFPAATNVTLATAVRLNAAFPYITPAVSLPTDPPLRLVDAGYLDNSGVGIATDWILAHADWIKENTSGVALIQIQTYPVEEQKRRADTWLGRLGQAMQPITAPLEGYAAAKAQLLDSRNAARLASVQSVFDVFDGPRFKSFVLKCPGDFQAPLSWRLSHDAIDRLGEGLRANNAEMTRFKCWIEARPGG